MTGRNRYYKRRLFFPIRDRILLHLLDYVEYRDEFNQPDELTQFGISEAIALGRSTVSKGIRRLVKEANVREARAHVPSGKLRRTVYSLTDAGVAAANRRRREIEEEVVVFRDGRDVDRRLRLAELPRLVPEYATLLDVVNHVSEGVFDAASFHPRRGRTFVDLTDRMPRLRYFFGREREVAGMDVWVDSPTERVLVISGITGIGKTTLLTRKLDDWREERNLLFHRLMEWTTLRNVVQQLAEFLTRMGKRELAHYLEAREATDIEEVVSIVMGDLGNSPTVLVYDDYHNAEVPIRNFFYALRTALETANGTKLIVSGRSVPPFYDRKDVRVKGVVRELPLGGLDLASSEKILQARNLSLASEAIQTLYDQTGGHPLFLELVDSASASQAGDVHKYIEEEMLSRLTEAEAKALGVASVFRYPVHADGLFVDEDIHPATIRGLLEQSLLREVSAKVYEVHDVIRAFFLDALTPHDRRTYHRWAARFHMSQPAPDFLEGLYHFVEGGEVTSAARVAVKEGRAILRSGRSEELLGVLDRLLPGVEDPAHSAELHLLKAHLLNVRGELDDAVAWYRDVARTATGHAMEVKAAEAHRSLGDIFRRQRDVQEAEHHLEEALRLYRSLDNLSGEAETLASLGNLEEDLGDHGGAQRSYGRAQSLAQHLGMRHLEGDVEMAVSRLLASQGDLEGALERKRRALAIAEGLGDWHLLARFQVSLGATLFAMDRYDDALQTYEQAIETARRIGELRMLAFGLWNGAGAYILQAHLARAEGYLKEAGALFRKLREPVMEALVVQYYGLLWEKRGKWSVAKQHLTASLDRLRRLQSPLDLAKGLLDTAHSYYRNGETEPALQFVDEAGKIAEHLQADALLGETRRYRSLYAQRVSSPPTEGVPGRGTLPPSG